MLEKSSQFSSLENPVSRKTWMLPWILHELKNTLGKLAVPVNTWVLVRVEICVLCGWWFSNRFDLYIVPETPAIQLAVSCSELFFARCCALKRTETFRVGKQGYEFVSQSLKSDGLMFHSWHQSVWRRTKEVPQHGGSILDCIILPGTFRRKC